MFPLITSQAIALGRAKQGPARSAPQSAPEKPATVRPASETQARTSFVRRFFEGIALARLRRAETELRYYRQLHERDEFSQPTKR